MTGNAVSSACMRCATPGFPYVTLLGWELIRALAGFTVVVESVFNWPGLGFIAKTAIQNQDFFLIQAIVFVIAVMVVLSTSRSTSYKVLDPGVGLMAADRTGAAGRCRNDLPMPDEYTAQHHDVEEAEPSEDSDARPTVRGSRRCAHGGLLRTWCATSSASHHSPFLSASSVSPIFVPCSAPSDPNAVDLGNSLASPVWHGGSWSNPHRHRLARLRRARRLLYGARTSLAIGLLVVFLAGAFGVLVGLLGRLPGRPHRQLADGMGRCAGVFPGAVAWRCC